MVRISDLVKGSTGENPFCDSQARNFSDTKIINEFYPTSSYWSLFNDQHEILLGTRGSGKTFLLKTMRYSMLKKLRDPRAEQLVKEKKFLALYVPMYLEFVTHITIADTSEKKQIQLFQFAFNCLLAQSLLTELTSILEEESVKYERAKKNIVLASALNDMWFNDGEDDISDLFSLTTKIRKLFYNFDMTNSNIDSVPPIFKRQIGATLLSAKELIAEILNFQEEPTWIICIDEAEFLTEPLQKCINNVFRSDSKRITLKVATLPYYHKTLEALEPSITVSAGNDFSYRVVDMKYDSPDFYNLTNTLCSNRIKTRFDGSLKIERLEDFVGVLGADDLIDYYRQEVGVEKSTYERIEKDIIEEFSDKRKRGSSSYTNPRKTIYDKFAPVFFVRSMYRLSKKGNTKPGWYAGSPMIRKISQGNPRIFIQIMNKLFEKARKFELTAKAQHGIIYDYVQSFCESTQALETHGPSIYKELNNIATLLHDQVHGQNLRSAGCSFSLCYGEDEFFYLAKQWLQLAVAYSRLIVDEDTLKNGIKENTEYLLANTYAAKYWLPMRADSHVERIKIIDNQVHTYTVNIALSPDQQLSFLEEI